MESTSASYQLPGGYRQGVFDPVITFELFAQDTSSERPATARAGTSVTTDPTGLAVGDFVAVVQDVGASQVAAVGQITSVGAGTITLDALAGGAPVIDGTNDVVYLLEGTGADMGELTSSGVTTALVGFNVSTDVDGGYVVQVFEDDDLRTADEAIADVTDGNVTAGAEEYGARSSDTTLTDSTFDTADTAFTANPQEVASESGTRFEDRHFVTLKAAISEETPDGAYGQTLSFIVSGNF
ncbi:hypothetical protein HY734_03725 [Candidatus Uhrbacteria bacterium]|nr:hypothetical protein [Candidatus Uhrbacteria bacterium]